MAMYELAREICAEIGFDLSCDSAGGGSDGNFTGAMGIPTLDSLGVRGAGLHTLNEHIKVDSLLERARLIAGLLMRLE
jgi:glutamate carboxypeptidase